MKIAEILTESLDSSYKYRRLRNSHSDNNTEVRYRFRIDNKDDLKYYTLYFDKYSYYPKHSDLDWWNVSFSDSNYNVMITNDRNDITFKVLGTVKKLIVKFAKANKDAAFRFSSFNSEPSRVKAYQTLTKRIAPTLGYEFNISRNAQNTETIFELFPKGVNSEDS